MSQTIGLSQFQRSKLKNKVVGFDTLPRSAKGSPDVRKQSTCWISSENLEVRRLQNCLNYINAIQRTIRLDRSCQ